MITYVAYDFPAVAVCTDPILLTLQLVPGAPKK